MGHGDKAYYRRRLQQEFAAANNACSKAACALHLELAERYSAKLRLIAALSANTDFAEPRYMAMPTPGSAVG